MKRLIGSDVSKLFNSKAVKDKRNNLRNNQTSTEYKLWRYLKNKQINGYKFRRQHSIGKFIVDFYCPTLKLAIEVDGANHFFDKKSTAYDLGREQFIKSFGIKIIRISSAEINTNIDGVIETILHVSKPPLTPP